MSTSAANPDEILRPQFAEDTRIERVDDTHFTAKFQPGWDIGGTPNGGYIMAIAARALAATLPHPHPMTITGHYIARSPGKIVDIETELLGQSRTTSTGLARLKQEGTARTHFTATFTDFDISSGPTHVHLHAPDLPPVDECEEHPFRDRMKERFGSHLDMKFHPDHMGWAVGTPSGRGEISGYIRLATGEDPDAFSLILFADAVPPAVFNLLGPTGWVPTIELTTHIRALPAPGWVKFRFTTEILVNGLFEEVGTLWDSGGRLVAHSRQIAKLLVRNKS